MQAGASSIVTSSAAFSLCGEGALLSGDLFAAIGSALLLLPRRPRLLLRRAGLKDERLEDVSSMTGDAALPRERERTERGVGLSSPDIFGPGELNCKRSTSDAAVVCKRVVGAVEYGTFYG